MEDRFSEKHLKAVMLEIVLYLNLTAKNLKG